MIAGIIAFIFVFPLSLYLTANEETKQRWAEETVAEDQKQQAELEKQTRVITSAQDARAQDIEPSKLKRGFGTGAVEELYYNKAEMLLTEYVSDYKGKDKSGKTMRDTLIDFSDCNSKSEFKVEIDEWNDKIIKIRLNSDWAESLNCGSNWYLDFNYDPRSDRLTYEPEQTFVELAESVMNYLDINP